MTKLELINRNFEILDLGKSLGKKIGRIYVSKDFEMDK